MDANAPGADTPGGDADRADAPGRDGRAPFAWSCPGCGADIDAPDQVFEVTAAALVPHANYLLVAVRCHTCERRTDAAVWIDRSALARQAEAGPGDLAPEVPESAALLDRYRAMVEESQARWERALGREEWVIEAEHASLHLEFETTRCTAVPARVVAEARGWRKALERQWGQLAPPVGALQVGHLLCVLSEDPMGGPPYTRGESTPPGLSHAPGEGTLPRPVPSALHLSVSNLLAPHTLTLAETEFVLSLFFSPGERPLLGGHGGVWLPMLHVYLDSEFLDPEAC